MILGAQQLGRFRLNSLIYIVAGLVVTGVLLVLDLNAGHTAVPEPPASLAFTVLALSFLIPAVVGHVDKPRNYHASGEFPPPRLIEVSCDGKDVWRYCLYPVHGARPIDPLVEGVVGVAGLEQAKTYAQERLDALCTAYNQATHKLTWLGDGTGRRSVGQLTDTPSGSA
jgi:hypothetical protein